MELKEKGAFDWGAYRGKDTALKYLKPGELEKISNGDYTVAGYKENGAMIISSNNYTPKWVPGTQWRVNSHQAGGAGGSVLIKSILNTKRFDFHVLSGVQGTSGLQRQEIRGVKQGGRFVYRDRTERNAVHVAEKPGRPAFLMP